MNILTYFDYKKAFSLRFSRSGFTLVELLVVIAIIAVLAGVVVFVINPGEMLAEGRDSQRSTDTKSISEAVNLFIFDNRTYSLGTSKSVYISIPDTSTTCSNITGLPTLPSGWTYACSTAANYKKIDGTGWVPLNLNIIKEGSPLPSLPVDPTNTKDSFYSYIASSNTYSVSAKIESLKSKQSNQTGVLTTNFVQGSNSNIASIPQGGDWINVPGSSVFGTFDFKVMKYEAKCVDQDGAALFSPTEGTHETYYDISAPCTAANNRYISSRKDGYPIVSVSHNNAKIYCQSIGAHLLTNEEYMTIARNAEQIASNWTLGVVGGTLSHLYEGHDDITPGKALQASTDNNGYFGTQNTSGSSQKRTLTLSNGEVIWDLAGNVWEHVQRTSADTQTSITTPSCSSGTAWQWCQYKNISPYVTYWPVGYVERDQVGPSVSTWDSLNQGIGQIYTNSGAIGGSVFMRGGHWEDYGSLGGVYSLFLRLAGADASVMAGFRCAK